MKLTLRQIRKIVLCLALIVLAGGIGYQLGQRNQLEPKVSNLIQPASKTEVNLELFWDVWGRLENSFLIKEVLKPQEMVWGAIEGMVASLDDPYTVFLTPENNQQAKEDLNGAFEGVGIQLGYKDDQLAVMAPIKGMPAEKAGVKAGDYILKIDEKEAVGMSLPEVVKLIRGIKGTKVTLTLMRGKGNEPFAVTIIREEIIVPSVELEFKDQVPVLGLTRFGDRTNQEWEMAVNEVVEKCLRSTECPGMILDLRNNPGGYLQGSVFIASEFLSNGIVVQQESAQGLKESFSVNRRGKLTEIKLVVLVNEGSASASEIVAGALQDHKRATIVGEKTFGKGTIQEAQDLSGGAGLHITTARWLLPKGRSIDKSGITPDMEVVDDLGTEADEQLEKGLQVLLKS
jgi:carboxyl-terminal processing protease